MENLLGKAVAPAWGLINQKAPTLGVTGHQLLRLPWQADQALTYPSIIVTAPGADLIDLNSRTWRVDTHVTVMASADDTTHGPQWIDDAFFAMQKIFFTTEIVSDLNQFTADSVVHSVDFKGISTEVDKARTIVSSIELELTMTC